MSMSAISGLQDASAGLWAQLQQQQAQRTADQAEQRARSLRSQANDAQASAERVLANARTLKIRASEADNEAASAALGAVQSKSGESVQSGLSNLHQQLSAILSSSASDNPSTSSAQPVLNAEGQTTGAVISVAA